MYKGSCQCGAVRYEIEGPVRDVIACHCRDCRKMSGHYFAATATGWENINIVDEGELAWYESSRTSRGDLLAAVPARLALAQRLVYVRAAVCHQVAQRETQREPGNMISMVGPSKARPNKNLGRSLRG